MSNFVPTHDRIKHDTSLSWRPGRVFLPAMNFSGLINGVTGLHTGAPVVQEISTFGVGAVMMDTAADELNTFMRLPYDMDLSKRIYARVHWTSGSADVADTVTWKVWYRALTTNVTAIAAAGATGGTALSQVVLIQTVPVATAYVWCTTTEGYIDAGTLSARVEALIWSVEMDAFAAGLAEDKFLLGLELRYTPRRLSGPDGMLQEAKASIFSNGKTYAN